MLNSELDEVQDFLKKVAAQGYINDNTSQGRQTACAKLFSVLEPDQRTVAYVTQNIDAIKRRFQNLNKDVRGQTVDEYVRRTLFAVNDYLKWVSDRGSWEREAGNRGKNADGEKKVRAPRAEKVQAAPEGAAPNADVRMVTYPLRPEFDSTMTLPRYDFTVAEARKLYLFLLTIASDFDHTVTPQQYLKLLEQNSSQDLNG